LRVNETESQTGKFVLSSFLQLARFLAKFTSGSCSHINSLLIIRIDLVWTLVTNTLFLQVSFLTLQAVQQRVFSLALHFADEDSLKKAHTPSNINNFPEKFEKLWVGSVYLWLHH
jgi:hypothetical protein